MVLGGLALSVVAGAGFAWFELRSAAPLVDLRLFRDRAFSAANGVSLLTGYTLATAIIGGPVFVNRVLFGTDADASVALTALTLAIAGGALVGGFVSGVVGERIVTVVGVLLSAAGLWFALAWGVETDLDRLVPDLALFGVGFGLTVAPRATAAVEAAGAIAALRGSELRVIIAKGGPEDGIGPLALGLPAHEVVHDRHNPVHALSDADADLVVVGSRGLHGLRALGSVSERVAHRSHASVLVVR
jgi:nucleotide-binding universal stress UspA family protein